MAHSYQKYPFIKELRENEYVGMDMMRVITEGSYFVLILCVMKISTLFW